MSQFIEVAAAAIVNAADEVLIAKRAAHRHQGDRWEFPGGKLEPGETAEQALIRELQEELGITVSRCRPLITVSHHYGDKSVRLHVFRVDAFSGEPHGHEGQPLAWVPAAQLSQYEFPAANLPIIAAVQLPDRLMITPEPTENKNFLAKVERACQRGVRMIQLRAHTLPDAAYRQLAVDVHAICQRHGCALMLNRRPELIADLSCDGWHLSSENAAKATAAGLPSRPRWLSLACHDEAQLQLAQTLNADFLLLSPVAETRSHPEQPGLGWRRFAELARQANRPVYALGGMLERDIFDSWQHGGQGIAAIRALWPEHD
ncbi:Nudix family hydrolase [Permianibacter sp. IMCC34836]|uniref:Nudix family hydrolase n=1 Tax=Permianibacter fluminis TaxID=2738515 RepID=UPI0015540D28|nr:Nudix family hydrolase [Permianibacter fluminis]NQD37024.1 Nudix family hydrolase [Permianibacter fluminis]